MSEPSDQDLEIHRLKGELLIEGRTLEWWAEEMLFWRTKYLMEHPEHNNETYVRTAREDEKIDPWMFL